MISASLPFMASNEAAAFNEPEPKPVWNFTPSAKVFGPDSCQKPKKYVALAWPKIFSPTSIFAYKLLDAATLTGADMKLLLVDAQPVETRSDIPKIVALFIFFLFGVELEWKPRE